MSETNNEEKMVADTTPLETPAPANAAPVREEPKKKKPLMMIVAAVLIVVITLLVVLFLLEKEGRSSTGIFNSYFASQEAGMVVATVNGTELTNGDLATSIEQFNQAAVAQGVDTTDPQVQADIKSQSLEVLINTELLKQEAVEQGIEVTEAQAIERLAEIETEIGGAEVLDERMAALGLTREQLQDDIQDEILIQSLLDNVFAEANIAVTDEEIQEVYDAAGGVDAGLPALAEVKDQVEAQIRSSKEQEAIDAYLAELKAGAEIEIVE